MLDFFFKRVEVVCIVCSNIDMLGKVKVKFTRCEFLLQTRSGREKFLTNNRNMNLLLPQGK